MEDNTHDLSTTLYKSKWGKQLVPPKYNDAITINSLIVCDKCNKEFKNKYTLWLHAKTCLGVKSNSDSNSDTKSNSESRPNMTESQSYDIVMKLIEQNKELLKNNIELTDKNKTLTDKLIEPIQSPNNSTFNLNFYINNIGTEQVNTDELINSVKSEIKQLEGLDKPKDVSNIITKQLEGLDKPKEVPNTITKQLEYLEIPNADIKRIPSYTKSDSSWIKNK